MIVRNKTLCEENLLSQAIVHPQCKHSCADDQATYGTARGPGGHKEKSIMERQKGKHVRV